MALENYESARKHWAQWASNPALSEDERRRYLLPEAPKHSAFLRQHFESLGNALQGVIRQQTATQNYRENLTKTEKRDIIHREMKTEGFFSNVQESRTTLNLHLTKRHIIDNVNRDEAKAIQSLNFESDVKKEIARLDAEKLKDENNKTANAEAIKQQIDKEIAELNTFLTQRAQVQEAIEEFATQQIHHRLSQSSMEDAANAGPVSIGNSAEDKLRQGLALSEKEKKDVSSTMIRVRGRFYNGSVELTVDETRNQDGSVDIGFSISSACFSRNKYGIPGNEYLFHEGRMDLCEAIHERLILKMKKEFSMDFSNIEVKNVGWFIELLTASIEVSMLSAERQAALRKLDPDSPAFSSHLIMHDLAIASLEKFLQEHPWTTWWSGKTIETIKRRNNECGARKAELLGEEYDEVVDNAKVVAPDDPSVAARKMALAGEQLAIFAQEEITRTFHAINLMNKNRDIGLGLAATAMNELHAAKKLAQAKQAEAKALITQAESELKKYEESKDEKQNANANPRKVRELKAAIKSAEENVKKTDAALLRLEKEYKVFYDSFAVTNKKLREEIRKKFDGKNAAINKLAPLLGMHLSSVEKIAKVLFEAGKTKTPPEYAALADARNALDTATREKKIAMVNRAYNLDATATMEALTAVYDEFQKRSESEKVIAIDPDTAAKELVKHHFDKVTGLAHRTSTAVETTMAIVNADSASVDKIGTHEETSKAIVKDNEVLAIRVAGLNSEKTSNYVNANSDLSKTIGMHANTAIAIANNANTKLKHKLLRGEPSIGANALFVGSGKSAKSIIENEVTAKAIVNEKSPKFLFNWLKNDASTVEKITNKIISDEKISNKITSNPETAKIIAAKQDVANSLVLAFAQKSNTKLDYIINTAASDPALVNKITVDPAKTAEIIFYAKQENNITDPLLLEFLRANPGAIDNLVTGIMGDTKSLEAVGSSAIDIAAAVLVNLPLADSLLLEFTQRNSSAPAAIAEIILEHSKNISKLVGDDATAIEAIAAILVDKEPADNYKQRFDAVLDRCKTELDDVILEARQKNPSELSAAIAGTLLRHPDSDVFKLVLVESDVRLKIIEAALKDFRKLTPEAKRKIVELMLSLDPKNEAIFLKTLKLAPQQTRIDLIKSALKNWESISPKIQREIIKLMLDPNNETRFLTTLNSLGHDTQLKIIEGALTDWKDLPLYVQRDIIKFLLTPASIEEFEKIFNLIDFDAQLEIVQDLLKDWKAVPVEMREKIVEFMLKDNDRFVSISALIDLTPKELFPVITKILERWVDLSSNMKNEIIIFMLDPKNEERFAEIFKSLDETVRVDIVKNALADWKNVPEDIQRDIIKFMFDPKESARFDSTFKLLDQKNQIAIIETLLMDPAAFNSLDPITQQALLAQYGDQETLIQNFTDDANPLATATNDSIDALASVIAGNAELKSRLCEILADTYIEENPGASRVDALNKAKDEITADPARALRKGLSHNMGEGQSILDEASKRINRSDASAEDLAALIAGTPAVLAEIKAAHPKAFENNTDLKIEKVRENGHCFYYAIAVNEAGRKLTHAEQDLAIKELRGLVADELLNPERKEAYKKEFEEMVRKSETPSVPEELPDLAIYQDVENKPLTFDAYVEEVRSGLMTRSDYPGRIRWADDVSIEALANLRGRPIHAFDTNNSTSIPLKFPLNHNNSQPLLVSFNGLNHYDAVTHDPMMPKTQKILADLIKNNPADSRGDAVRKGINNARAIADSKFVKDALNSDKDLREQIIDPGIDACDQSMIAARRDFKKNSNELSRDQVEKNASAASSLVNIEKVVDTRKKIIETLTKAVSGNDANTVIEATNPDVWAQLIFDDQNKDRREKIVRLLLRMPKTGGTDEQLKTIEATIAGINEERAEFKEELKENLRAILKPKSATNVEGVKRRGECIELIHEVIKNTRAEDIKHAFDAETNLVKVYEKIEKKPLTDLDDHPWVKRARESYLALNNSAVTAAEYELKQAREKARADFEATKNASHASLKTALKKIMTDDVDLRAELVRFIHSNDEMKKAIGVHLFDVRASSTVRQIELALMKATEQELIAAFTDPKITGLTNFSELQTAISSYIIDNADALQKYVEGQNNVQEALQKLDTVSKTAISPANRDAIDSDPGIQKSKDDALRTYTTDLRIQLFKQFLTDPESIEWDNKGVVKFTPKGGTEVIIVSEQNARATLIEVFQHYQDEVLNPLDAAQQNCLYEARSADVAAAEKELGIASLARTKANSENLEKITGKSSDQLFKSLRQLLTHASTKLAPLMSDDRIKVAEKVVIDAETRLTKLQEAQAKLYDDMPEKIRKDNPAIVGKVDEPILASLIQDADIINKKAMPAGGTAIQRARAQDYINLVNKELARNPKENMTVAKMRVFQRDQDVRKARVDALLEKKDEIGFKDILALSQINGDAQKALSFIESIASGDYKNSVSVPNVESPEKAMALLETIEGNSKVRQSINEALDKEPESKKAWKKIVEDSDEFKESTEAIQALTAEIPSKKETVKLAKDQVDDLKSLESTVTAKKKKVEETNVAEATDCKTALKANENGLLAAQAQYNKTRSGLNTSMRRA